MNQTSVAAPPQQADNAAESPPATRRSPVPAVTIAFTDREWAEIDQLAQARGVTPVAIIRACVQHALSTATPNPCNDRRPKAALVITDSRGQRICPDCGADLRKKNLNGPGRYPAVCETCR